MRLHVGVEAHNNVHQGSPMSLKSSIFKVHESQGYSKMKKENGR